MVVITILPERLEISLEIDLLLIQAEFKPDAVSVRIDRIEGYPDNLRYLLCGPAVLYEIGYLGFPLREIELLHIVEERGHDSLEIGPNDIEVGVLFFVQPPFFHLLQVWENELVDVDHKPLFEVFFVLLHLVQEDFQCYIEFFDGL